MSSLLKILTNISVGGLLAISIYNFIRYRNTRSFVFQLFLIGLCFVFLYKFFFISESVVAKGDENEILFMIVLYLFMLMGMFANYAYSRFSKIKTKREKFDFGMFIAPTFASPIIFIPLMAAFQNASLELQKLTTAKLMVFLVAFQNGFFWKEYFDNIQRERKHGTKAKKTK
jgi:hypothetical protein